MKVDFKPLILDPARTKDRRKIVSLKKNAIIIDRFNSEVSEYLNIPLYKQKRDNQDVFRDVWVYFPWKKTLVRLLREKYFFRLKNSRNLFLLTEDEQERYYQFKIGIAGLSVGCSIGVLLAMEGGGHYFKLADHDRLTLSNLNRMPGSLVQLNTSKVDIVSQFMFEINPYLRIVPYYLGLNSYNIDGFISRPRLDILIEELDDLSIKKQLRAAARKAHIPLIMATSLDSKIIIDYEAYDQDPLIKPFNGYLSNYELRRLSSRNLQSKAWGAQKIVGKTNFSKRLNYSFKQLGKNIIAFPQFGSGSFLRSAIIAHFIRYSIISKKRIKSGRYKFDLDKVFSPNNVSSV